MLIPIAVGLLGPDGADLPLVLRGTPAPAPGQSAPTTAVLRLEAAEGVFVFEGVKARPVVSLLRGFSAPVRLESDATEDDLVRR